jgi:branched-chain amino acid transport system permease protein
VSALPNQAEPTPARAAATRTALTRSAFPAMTPARWTVTGGLVAVACVIPVVMTNQYALSVMVTTLILLVLNISWNFVLGVAGVWNFGQLAIYALGGYGAGIIMLHTSLPPWLAVLAGGVVGAFAAVLLAFPTLRLYGIYTSLLTFAFAEVIQYVIVNDGSGLTGGTFGLPIVKGLYSSLSLAASARAYYWTVLAVVVASTIGLAAVGRSRLGIALRGIRDAPAYAAARGVSPTRYRVIAFAVSGFLAGIAGGLYVSYNQSISPSAMGLTPMSIDVTMLVIGGLGTATGPIIGTILLAVVQTALVSHPGAELTILGIFLLVVVVFVPDGLTGLAARYWRRVGAWAAEDDQSGAAAGEEAGGPEAAGPPPAEAGAAAEIPEGSPDPNVA